MSTMPDLYLNNLIFFPHDPVRIDFSTMSQCVPSRDVNFEDALEPLLSIPVEDLAQASVAALEPEPDPEEVLSILASPDLSGVNCDVAELTWENGQLLLHGHSQMNAKPDAASPGTLESLVNQATSGVNNAGPDAGKKPGFACMAGNVPLENQLQARADAAASASASASSSASASAATTVTLDVIVPFLAWADDMHWRRLWMSRESLCNSMGVDGSCSGNVGSSSAMGGNWGMNPGEEYMQESMWQTLSGGGEWVENPSMSGSATYCYNATQDTYGLEPELGNVASQGSPQDMNHGEGGGEMAPVTATALENVSVFDQAQVCEATNSSLHSGLPSESKLSEFGCGEKRGEEEKGEFGVYSPSAKRSRAAIIHNQSERRRRDRINQKMKTLQDLVPNSSKLDKASMLDEVISYMKQMQAQVHQMMSRMNLPMPPPPPMMPLTVQQQLQLSMMSPPMGLGVGLPGMPPGDTSCLGCNRFNIPGVPPTPPAVHPFAPIPPGDRFATNPAPTGVMPDPLSAFLASQSSPAMTMDAYSRLAAMYQHHMRQQQQQPPNPNPYSN